MKIVSRLVAVIGFGLMLIGLIGFLANGSLTSIPGATVLTVAEMGHLAQSSPTLLSMTIGIILLALLPAIRVLLALWTFSRHHAWINTLAALIVFLELVLSMRVGS